MSQFEVRAKLKVREGKLEEVHEAYVNADALVDHAFHIREARDAMFAEFAYDHQMALYGEPSPRLLELVNRIGVSPMVFTPLQALEPAGAH